MCIHAQYILRIMEASFEKLFCRLTTYLDRRIENNFRKLSPTSQRSDNVQSKINISDSDLKFRFSHIHFCIVKNPLVERKLLFRGKVFTLSNNRSKEISSVKFVIRHYIRQNFALNFLTLCSLLANDRWKRRRKFPRNFRMRCTNRRSSTAPRCRTHRSHRSARGLLNQSKVLALRHQLVIQLLQSPLPQWQWQEQLIGFTSTNDCLPDSIEKSITVAILANCKPFSGASPSTAISFTQELASRISKSRPVRFHTKINTNGRRFFYCRCKIDENSAYSRTLIRTATELKLDCLVKAHDVEMSLFGNALIADLYTFQTVHIREIRSFFAVTFSN